MRLTYRLREYVQDFSFHEYLKEEEAHQKDDDRMRYFYEDDEDFYEFNEIWSLLFLSLRFFVKKEAYFFLMMTI